MLMVRARLSSELSDGRHWRLARREDMLLRSRLVVIWRSTMLTSGIQSRDSVACKLFALRVG